MATNRLTDGVCQDVCDEIPNVGNPHWKRWDTGPQEHGKLEGSHPSMWGPMTKLIAEQLGSDEWLEGLSVNFGIPDLVPSTLGGGYHWVKPGGALGLHVDFSRHPEHPMLYRRLNCLIFLNVDWKDGWGGQLQLGRDDDRDTVLVVPHAGTVVAFETSDHSWHGHPNPVVCPPDRRRLSFAVYYFSPDPGPTPADDHSTVFLDSSRDGASSA